MKSRKNGEPSLQSREKTERYSLPHRLSLKTKWTKRKHSMNIISATLHEFGHFLDWTLGIPAEHEQLYLAEAQNSGLRDYSKTNAREYFADSFDYWIAYSGSEKRMETFRNAAPQTWAYFEALEKNNDEKGIIWPMSVAPFQVCIVPIKYNGAMKEVADTIYEKLTKAGIEVLLDDRDERPGVKFADMELIGIPLRITVGDKNLPNVEFKPRSAAEAELVPAESAAEKAIQFVKSELASC